MDETRLPGYIAILIPRVRYDPELSPNAKLLYAEITALSDARGYCFAQNSYFANLFHLSVKGASRLVSQLAEKGYITVEVIRDPETKIVKERRIWVEPPPRNQADTSPHDCGDPSPQSCGDPPPRKEETPPRRIAEENDLSSFNEIPPISPKEKRRGSEVPKEVQALLTEYTRDKPSELCEALMGFMEIRAKRKAVNTSRAVKALLAELEKLSGGSDAMRLDLVNTAVLNGWKSVYPLKDRGGTSPPQAEEGAWV